MNIINTIMKNTQKNKDYRPRLSKGLNNLTKGLKGDKNRVLVIGDLHEPFCLDTYLNIVREFTINTIAIRWCSLEM